MLEDNKLTIPLMYFEPNSIIDIKVRFKTLQYLSHCSVSQDLQHAKEYIQLLETAETSKIKNSLFISAVISYYKAFDKSSNAKIWVLSDGDTRKNLTADELKQHELLITYRNQLIAHQDITDLHQTKICLVLEPNLSNKRINGLGFFSAVMVNSNKEENIVILELIDKFLECVEVKKSNLSSGIIDWFSLQDVNFIYSKATY